jgi:hypothetical protein
MFCCVECSIFVVFNETFEFSFIISMRISVFPVCDAVNSEKGIQAFQKYLLLVSSKFSLEFSLFLISRAY